MNSTISNSQEALRDQSALLQAILDSLGDAVIVADLRGRFLVYNPAAVRMFGPPLPAGEEEGPACLLPDQKTLFPPEQLPLVRALRGEPVDDVEMFIQHPATNRDIWTRITGRPLADANGQRLGGVIVCRDITERRRTEKVLLDNAQLIQDLYNNAPCGYQSLDDGGDFLSVNDTVLGWLGYECAEILGKKRFEDLLTPRSKSVFHRVFPLLKEEGRLNNVEFELVRKDGAHVPILLNASAVRDAQGNYLSSRATLFDISERKRAEEKIRRLNDDLERRVAERTRELFEANGQLAQQNWENATFVSSVSHDLRSPLVNLEGFSQELEAVCRELRPLLEQLPPEARQRALGMVDGDMAESIRFISTAVRRLSSIIDALLRLSRAGRVEYQCTQIDTGPLVRRVVDSLHATSAERGATISVQDLPALWGDPPAVELIFANLIGNALNYLDRRRPGIIEVGAQAATGPEEARVIFVRDNGLGIPEAYQGKVFQAFQRLHPQAAAGEGMGLAIVRRIVERHGGRIWLESRAGEGSTFFVALPGGPQA